MTGSMLMKKCDRCGRFVDAKAFVCIYCGYDFRGRWILPTAGGLLSIFAGIATLVYTWPQTFYVAAAIVAILGGTVAVYRKSFPLAVAGCVGAILGPGFYLGVPALIMVVIARKSFKHPETRMQQ